MTLSFKDVLTTRPLPTGIDIVTKLHHFSIITYDVDPNALRKYIPKRFTIDTIEIDGVQRGLVSVVPFVDVDFTSAVFPFPSFEFGQTNYRAYITDSHTGERAVWFFGTILDSWTIAIPRLFWRLPWYRGSVRFQCKLEDSVYQKYEMSTESKWAPAIANLETLSSSLIPPGFSSEESALVFLTHPLAGFYRRLDGQLGSYRVWHDKLEVSWGRAVDARFDLLDRLDLVRPSQQATPHSVLMQHAPEFTIYLPPRVHRDSR